MTGEGSRGLKVSQILGCSLRSSSHFDVQGNVIAYVASGGVVVGEINNGTITNQRFFVATTEATTQNSDYLDMISELSLKSPTKDKYGFSHSSPITINTINEDTDIQTKLRDRVRIINCIAVSPDGKLLAIGESGYQPRILLYSLARDLINTPIAIIYSHTFGIAHLKFSANSLHLCSLGLINDGVLNIWKVGHNHIELIASNKCSSVINQVLWEQNKVITLGNRIIKVWTLDLEQPKFGKPSILKGKNVILKQFINCNFLNATYKKDQLLILTNVHKVLVLTDNEHLSVLDQVIDGEAVLYHNNKLWVSNEGQIDSIEESEREINLSDDIPFSPGKLETVAHGYRLIPYNDSIIYANGNNLLMYETQSSLFLIGSLGEDLAGIKSYSDKCIVFDKKGNIEKVDLASWRPEKLLQFDLPTSDILVNIVTAVDVFGKEIAIGDKYGHLYIASDKYQIKAHESTITDIVIFEMDEIVYLASISRDRMIQIFYKLSGKWDLLQTLPVHAGRLLLVKYHNSRIYVCSNDKNVSIHKVNKLEVILEKVITLKSTPNFLNIFNDDIIISTNDRNLHIFNSKTFEPKRTMKLMNDKINELLLIENFVVHNNILYASSSDKSLRSFVYASGKPVTVNYGHLDTISSLRVLNNHLLSASIDGCIILWDLVHETTPVASPKVGGLNIFTEKVTRKVVPTRKLEPEVLQSPLVASPRLSSATLKRMEARKQAEKSPSSPSRSQLSPSPSRNQLSPSPLPRRTPDFKSVKLLSPEKVLASDDMKKVNAHILQIRSIIQRGDIDRDSVRTELKSLLCLVGDEEEKILERYSEKLLEIINKKLNT